MYHGILTGLQNRKAFAYNDIIEACVNNSTAVTQILQTSVLALNSDAATNKSNTDRKQQRTEVIYHRVHIQ